MHASTPATPAPNHPVHRPPYHGTDRAQTSSPALPAGAASLLLAVLLGGCSTLSSLCYEEADTDAGLATRACIDLAAPAARLPGLPDGPANEPDAVTVGIRVAARF